MADVRLTPTANRSVVGVLNEFARLADLHRADLHRAAGHDIDGDSLLKGSLQLARTPLSPLYARHVSPGPGARRARHHTGYRATVGGKRGVE